MPKASVKRLIETEKEKLIDLVLDIDNSKIYSCIIQKFMNEMI